MKIRYTLMLAVLGIALSSPAFAITLNQARSSAAVGEKLDGYLAALKATPEVKALVADINAKRKQEYTRISKQNGQSIDVVAKLAAGQILKKIPAGTMYQTQSKSWKAR